MGKKVIHIDLPKIRIKTFTGGTETRTMWPKGWRAEYANIVAYEDTVGDETGNLVKGAIAVIDEDNWPLFKDLSGIREITDEEANTLGRKWKPRVMRVDTDKAIVAMAEIIRKHIPALTAQERKILNPEDSTPGVNWSPEFNIEGLKK